MVKSSFETKNRTPYVVFAIFWYDSGRYKHYKNVSILGEINVI